MTQRVKISTQRESEADPMPDLLINVDHPAAARGACPPVAP
jgi:hypothetical protein